MDAGLHCYSVRHVWTYLQCVLLYVVKMVKSAINGKQGYKTCSILNSTSQNTHQGSRTWIQCYTLTSQSQFAAMKLCVQQKQWWSSTQGLVRGRFTLYNFSFLGRIFSMDYTYYRLDFDPFGARVCKPVSRYQLYMVEPLLYRHLISWLNVFISVGE